MSVVIGANVTDYDTVFECLWHLLQIHVDCGCAILVSEKSKGFVPYLIKRLCRGVVMTPGMEEENMLKGSMCVLIVTASPQDKAVVLKEKLDQARVPNQLLVMNVPRLNPVSFAR